jgi:glycosyltransferase involved in cell wall biosynthesis
MPKISVVCVTNREGAVPFLVAQLQKQTFQDFEVIIADDLCENKLIDETFFQIPTTPYQHFKPRQKNEGDAWNLNKAHNDCLEKVNGELIVFLQDFIWIPANGLQRFWDMYQILPEALVTGVGHKYREDLKTIVETDERVFGERGMVESDWTYYELNWASCPKERAPQFDEDMDTHYGGENQIFALKSGLDVWIDRNNECKGIAHTDRRSNWEEKHANKGFLNEKIHGYFKGRTADRED